MEVELATCRTSLDLVCILLDRCIVCCSRWVRYKNRSVHTQFDSSPIAGPELFGMLMDVFFLGRTWVERCPSGVAMGHGHTACRDKCMNLLWVLVNHGAQKKMFRRCASAHQIFHNGPRCGGLYGHGEQ